jgi:hypothetical protein
VTELTRPLAATPEAAPPAAEETTVAEGAIDAPSVSFSEVVYAHFDWWRRREAGTLDERSRNAYVVAVNAFEAQHGEIVGSYWCSHIQSAVCLTQKRRPLNWLRGPVYGFHRESDWATQDSPDVAAELHRCDELAVRANTVLKGVRQRICMHLVVASAGHLLSLVDARCAHADETKTKAALRKEHAAIGEAEKYYREAANGQAQMVYFGGMAAVAIAISIFGGVWLALSWSTPVAALIAGALGALVSVVQRINSGKFTLDFDVGARYAFFLGGLRPLIGGAFAMVISFAFTGGLLHLPVSGHAGRYQRRLALLVLSFLAGFSERWAQDTLTAVLPGAGQPSQPSQPQPEQKPAAPDPG